MLVKVTSLSGAAGGARAGGAAVATLCSAAVGGSGAIRAGRQMSAKRFDASRRLLARVSSKGKGEPEAWRIGCEQ